MAGYLNINNLCCGYSTGFKLRGLSFSLEKGAFAGIIGPNGSGKTTLFRGIAGELHPNGGDIVLNGTSMQTLTHRQKAMNVGIVSQFPESIDISVEEYVLMGRLPYREPLRFFESETDIQIATKYMKLTGIYQHKDKYVSELSGGEQQLAAIAQALTQEPSLLLLDEPTSHLDICHQVQILNLIQELNRSLGLTVLMIVHDLNLASEYCDFLVMMHNGEIFTMGTPDEVLTYQNIETVYNTAVITLNNPVSQRPAVFLVSNRMLGKGKNGSPDNCAAGENG